MGKVQFNDSKVLFTSEGKVAMGADCCCDGVCPCCSGVKPLELQVVIEDIEDVPACLNFSDLNGTYIAAHCDTVPISSIYPNESACAWFYELPSTICADWDWLYIRMFEYSNSQYLQVLVSNGSAHTGMFGKKFATGTFPDCDAWSALDVPYAYDPDPGKCTVTAL